MNRMCRSSSAVCVPSLRAKRQANRRRPALVSPARLRGPGLAPRRLRRHRLRRRGALLACRSWLHACSGSAVRGREQRRIERRQWRIWRRAVLGRGGAHPDVHGSPRGLSAADPRHVPRDRRALPERRQLRRRDARMRVQSRRSLRGGRERPSPLPFLLTQLGGVSAFARPPPGGFQLGRVNHFARNRICRP